MKSSNSSEVGEKCSSEKSVPPCNSLLLPSPIVSMEDVICQVVQEGYDRSIVESALAKLQQEGLSLSNIDTAVLEITSYINTSEIAELAKSKCDAVFVCMDKTQNNEDKEVLTRLQKAASVPSILNVLVGFTKWYHSMPVSDVSLKSAPDL